MLELFKVCGFWLAGKYCLESDSNNIIRCCYHYSCDVILLELERFLNLYHYVHRPWCEHNHTITITITIFASAPAGDNVVYYNPAAGASWCLYALPISRRLRRSYMCFGVISLWVSGKFTLFGDEQTTLKDIKAPSLGPGAAAASERAAILDLDKDKDEPCCSFVVCRFKFSGFWLAVNICIFY